MDLKNMIAKQQKYIEDHDIGGAGEVHQDQLIGVNKGASAEQNDKSKLSNLNHLLDMDMFLEGGDLDLDD